MRVGTDKRMTLNELIKNYFDLSMEDKVKLINSIQDMTDDEYTEYFGKFYHENQILLEQDVIPMDEAKVLEETVLARRIAHVFQISIDAACYVIEMKKTGAVTEEEEKLLKEVGEKIPLFEEYFMESHGDFELSDVIEYNGQNYAVLIPCGENESGEAIVLQVELSDNEEQYIAVESQEIVTAVFEIFKEKHKEEFDFA